MGYVLHTRQHREGKIEMDLEERGAVLCALRRGRTLFGRCERVGELGAGGLARDPLRWMTHLMLEASGMIICKDVSCK